MAKVDDPQSTSCPPMEVQRLSNSVKAHSTNLVKDVQGVMKKEEQLMLSELWKPAALVIAQLWVLRFFSQDIEGVHDPFGGCSIVTPLVMTSLYLAVIFFGKRYMATREAFNMKHYIVTYNLYQIVLNVWWVAMTTQEVYNLGMSFWGNHHDPSPKANQLAFLIWVHYNNKYIELLDTVFMVARKKNDQISFLHVYHHTLLIWSWFIVIKVACGGDSYFGSMINSCVHVLMYTYYLLALLKVRVAFIRRNLTNIQMSQFCICATHSIYTITKEDMPSEAKWLAGLQMFVMGNMLVLFGNFYYQSYIKKGGKKAVTAAPAPPAALAVEQKEGKQE